MNAWAVFGYSILWIISWPITMTVVAVAAIIGAITFLQQNELLSIFEDPMSGTQSRGLVAIFVAFMVIICLICIKLQRRSRQPILTISAAVLTGYMWLGIILGGVIIVTTADPKIASTADAGINTQTVALPVTPTLKHEPKLMAALGQVGVESVKHLDVRYVEEYADKGALKNQSGEYQSFINPTTGEFMYGMLTVKKGLVPEELKTVVAHEYLHHIWYTEIDEPTKENLTSHLITLYGNDPAMRRQLEEYANKGRLYPTELFSYYCTESSDGYLTTFILKSCNTYIDRPALTFLR